MSGVRVLGVPSAWGASDPAVAETPARLRAAGLLDWLGDGDLDVEDGGDVPVPPGPAGVAWDDDPSAHLAPLADTCRAVRRAVEAALDAGRLPLLVGGECGLTIGAVAGLASRRGSPLLAWFDAHGDLNTPDTSPSGLLTGMPCAVVQGHGLPELVAVGDDAPRPRRVTLLGGRDLDAGERRHVRDWDVRHVETEPVRLGGAEETVAGILGILEVELLPPEARDPRVVGDAGVSPQPAGPTAADPAATDLYLHVDVDALDPDDAPGVGFPVPDGFRVDEVADVAGYLGVTGRVGALSVASADLERDDGRTVRALRTVLLSIADALALAPSPPRSSVST